MKKIRLPFQKHSFTLIEIIVTVGVVALALPVLFAIIFTITREQLKLYRLTEVKRQGDFAMSTMTTLIRNNAIGIYSEHTLSAGSKQCKTAGQTYSPATDGGATDDDHMFFQDKVRTDYWFRFYYNATQIASASSVVSPVGLNTPRVKVSNLTMKCSRLNQFSPPLVNISFNVCYNTGTAATQDCGNASSRVEETSPILHYSTNVIMLNY